MILRSVVSKADIFGRATIIVRQRRSAHCKRFNVISTTTAITAIMLCILHLVAFGLLSEGKEAETHLKMNGNVKKGEVKENQNQLRCLHSLRPQLNLVRDQLDTRLKRQLMKVGCFEKLQL